MQSNRREDVLAPFGYLGAGKKAKDATAAQLYLRQKSVLHGAEKFYKPEEFESSWPICGRG